MSRLSPCRPAKAPYVRDPVDEDQLRITTLDPDHQHVLASPLLEINRITIHPTNERSCRIYGEISLIDDKGTNFHLYNRSRDNPKFIEVGGVLSLTGIPIAPAKPCKLSFLLWDSDERSCIAKGSFDLDYTDVSDFVENLKVTQVHGDCGHISIAYRTFRAAAVAEISVSVMKKCSKVKGSENASIYGVIRSRFEEGKENVVTLFERDENEAVSVKLGRTIKLSRTMVSVRACSSLKVGVMLYDCKGNYIPVVKGLVQFRGVSYELDNRRQICGEDNKWLAIVEVDWSYRDKLLYQTFETTQVVDVPAVPRLRTKRHSVASPGPFELGLVEIFSVSIGCNGCTTSKETNIHGTIRVRDSIGKFYIFDGDGDEGSIRWPSRCAKASKFRMRFNLIDFKGGEFCKGYLDLSYNNVDLCKRECSVISGEYGCATVYYTVFSGALQGKVIIQYSSANSEHINIFGSIVARYDKFEYKSYYDKKYYQSLLFESSYETSIAHSSGSYLPLIKRAVVGPKDCLIIISLDLKSFFSSSLRPNTKEQSPVLVLKDEVKFKPGHDDSQNIKGAGFNIIVTLTWDKV